MSRSRAEPADRISPFAIAEGGYLSVGTITRSTGDAADTNDPRESLDADHVLIEHSDEKNTVFVLRLGEFFRVLGIRKPRVVRAVHQICGTVFKEWPRAKGRVIDFSFHSGDHLHFRFTGMAASERRSCAEMIVDTVGERILGESFFSFARIRESTKRGEVVSAIETPAAVPADIDGAFFAARRDANPAVGNDWRPVRKLDLETIEISAAHNIVATAKAVDGFPRENDWLIGPKPDGEVGRRAPPISLTEDEDWLLIRDIVTRHPNVTDADTLLAEIRALRGHTIENDWTISGKRRSSKTAQSDVPLESDHEEAVNRNTRRRAYKRSRDGTPENASPTAKAAPAGKVNRKG